MTLSLRELSKELAEGRLRPAYLLAGEEALLRDDALAALRAAALDGAAQDFNFDRFEGSSVSLAALRDSLMSLPLMAQRRLVLLGEPESRRAGAKAVLDALPGLLAELVEREDIVFVVTARRPDKRLRWPRAFAAPHATVDCEAPTRAVDLVAFVSAEAKRQAVSFAAGAAELLAERIGPQLLLLRQEIAKAALLAGDGAPVTRAVVEASTTQLAEQKIWDLTDAIGEGRRADALAILWRMRDAPAPVLLGALASHFRRLARVHAGDRVAGPPFVVRKLEAQARRLNGPRVVRGLRAIHSTDTAIKGASPLDPMLSIERLVLTLSS